MKRLDDRIGLNFLVGLSPSLGLTEADRDLLRALRPAGIILFRSNFDHEADYGTWLGRLDELLSATREAIGRDHIFVGIDHEGGRVCRVPAPLTRYSYPTRWASTAGAVGRAMGRELASIGVNMNFAPLLDIASNPENPVIGERAFGNDVDQVTQAAIAFMDGQREAGVVAVGKHFPGHGDTAVDSHHGLPVQSTDPAELRRREIAPFRATIAAGLDCVMTSHIVFSQIDATMPATLSHPIVTGILREELNFDGVVMTDDINMHAMDNYFSDPTAAVACLKAGTDMLMVCAHWNTNRRALDFADAIAGAAQTGAIARADLERSQARVERALAASSQHSVAPLDRAILRANRQAGALFEGATVEVI